MTASSSAGRPADERGRPRVTALDRILLGGRDPYRPVYLVRFVRLQYALLTAVLIAVLGAGYIAWSGQQRSRTVCLQRNAASVFYRVKLGELSEAAADRGDQRSATIFRELTPTTPLPRC